MHGAHADMFIHKRASQRVLFGRGFGQGLRGVLIRKIDARAKPSRPASVIKAHLELAQKGAYFLLRFPARELLSKQVIKEVIQTTTLETSAFPGLVCTCGLFFSEDVFFVGLIFLLGVVTCMCM